MLIVISPAKTLDFDSPAPTKSRTVPQFLEDSKKLINHLKTLSPDEIGKLMSISPKLATLNSNRYHQWSLPFDLKNAKQSIFAFKGDVYTGLQAESLSNDNLAFAQEHLLILSGLYGILRPLDLIQAYRLEMGTSLDNLRGKDLYAFWDNTITTFLNQIFAKQQNPVLINLASQEYFKSIQVDKLNAEVITPVFKDKKNGAYKIISFFAKKARGLMSRYIIQNELADPKDIKNFNLAGYAYNASESNQQSWIFSRDKLT